MSEHSAFAEAMRTGEAFFRVGDFGRAEDAFRAATELDGMSAAAWSNLGYVYQTCGLRDAAVECLTRAVRLDPRSRDALINMGWLTQEDGHLEAAKALFRRALEVDAGSALAKANLGVALLMEHDFAAAWEPWLAHYELEPKPPVAAALPIWDGQPCRRVAIWKEQGIGDEMLFASLIPELIGRGQDFVWEADERLLRALRRSFPSSTFAARRPKAGSVEIVGAERPIYSDELFETCDAQAPAGFLASLYRRSIDDFAAQPHQLFKAPFPITRIDPGNPLVIGIAWKSLRLAPDAAHHHTIQRKSATLKDFAPLAVPGVVLVNLQYGNTFTEVNECGFLVRQPGVDVFWDIEGLLALIESCDVIVTTCNATAHFAGALGKRCIVMYVGTPPLWSWSAHNGRSLWWRSCEVIAARTWGDAIEDAKARIFV